jgi:PspA associated protein B
MGLLDSLLGRSKPKKPDLDALFALPSAAVTLETSAGLKPVGAAAVCFKPASGQAFAGMRSELQDLLKLSAGQSDSRLEETDDEYGYHWLVVKDPDLSDLVGSIHLVNTTLEDRGFGPQLLCSVFGFSGGNRNEELYLVYLYKRGTFYPFAPRSGEKRDNELELRARGILAQDLKIEQDLTRWFPLWGVPIATA